MRIRQQKNETLILSSYILYINLLLSVPSKFRVIELNNIG